MHFVLLCVLRAENSSRLMGWTCEQCPSTSPSKLVQTNSKVRVKRWIKGKSLGASRPGLESGTASHWSLVPGLLLDLFGPQFPC